MPIYPTWAQVRKLRTQKYGAGIVGWWKQGWNEYPEVMFAFLHAVLGTGIIFYRVYNHSLHGTDIKKYKAEYTVYRPDDIRLKNYLKFYEPNDSQAK